ncbi:hypothetical protein BHE74_00025881 [Ensete ventricosum]|nr:hypothetical protein GW17_00039240 [Ensete ventricosum]RWW66738.1 hypothetical protein BHE74_00025881 [Ensete ventricosum]RZS04298.1 hypothetical protein BHM03_00034618 [Ensete ventricosum]
MGDGGIAQATVKIVSGHRWVSTKDSGVDVGIEIDPLDLKSTGISLRFLEERKREREMERESLEGHFERFGPNVNLRGSTIGPNLIGQGCVAGGGTANLGSATVEDDWELTGSILKMIRSSLGVRRRDAGKFERSIDVPDNKID